MSEARLPDSSGAEPEDEHWLVATELSSPTSVTAACAGRFVAHGAAAALPRPQLAVARQHRLDIWQRCAEDDDEFQLLLSATLTQRIDHLAALPGAPGGADGLLVISSAGSAAPDGAACADVSVWVARCGAGGALSLARCVQGGAPYGPPPRAAAAAGDTSGGAAAGGARGPPRLEGPLATPMERAGAGHADPSSGGAAWLLALAAHADKVQALRVSWAGAGGPAVAVSEAVLDLRAPRCPALCALRGARARREPARALRVKCTQASGGGLFV